MALPSTSVRTAAKQKLTELLAEALPGVQVLYGHQPRVMQNECVWTDDISQGEVTVAAQNAVRQPRDDRFVIDVYCFAKVPGRTCLEQEVRVEELYAALENVLADHPTLEMKPVIAHAIQKGPCIGPESDAVEEGFESLISASVEVLSRLH